MWECALSAIGYSAPIMEVDRPLQMQTLKAAERQEKERKASWTVMQEALHNVSRPLSVVDDKQDELCLSRSTSPAQQI